MLYPTLTEVQELLEEYDVVPVFYEVLSDSMTPIHIFNALKEQSNTCFILELSLIHISAFTEKKGPPEAVYPLRSEPLRNRNQLRKSNFLSVFPTPLVVSKDYNY